MTNPDKIKVKLYEDLESVITAAPSLEKLIILGDFNARVVSDYTSWEGVIGISGVGSCNNNGNLLLRSYAANDLLITNTSLPLAQLKQDVLDASTL